MDAIDEPNPVTDDSAQRALTDQLLVQLRAQAAPIALALGGVSVAVRVDPDARLWWMDAPPSASPPMRGQLLGMSFRLAGVVARCACVFEGFEPDEAGDLWRLRDPCRIDYPQRRQTYRAVAALQGRWLRSRVRR